jgi:HK97 family phage major capsid protein
MAAAVDIARERQKAGIEPLPVLPPEWNQKSFLRTVVKDKKYPERLTNLERHVTRQLRGEVAKASMGESSGARGGYLAPPEFSLKLFNSVKSSSIMWGRTQRVPMASTVTTCPRPRYENVSTSGVSPWFGGITFTCGSFGGEGPQGSTYLAETEPQFGSVELKVCEVVGMLVVSNQFVADLSDEGEEELATMFGRAAAWAFDWLCFNGTGANNLQPLGIINSPALITNTRTTHNKITEQDLTAMDDNLADVCWENAIWACSPSAFGQISQVSGYTVNQYPGRADIPNQAGWLTGKPVVITEKLPALGKTGDVLLFDPTFYVIGDRGQCIIDASSEALFSTMQTVFRVWLRADGKPLLSNSVTLANGDSVSAYVALTAP